MLEAFTVYLREICVPMYSETVRIIDDEHYILLTKTTQPFLANPPFYSNTVFRSFIVCTQF